MKNLTKKCISALKYLGCVYVGMFLTIMLIYGISSTSIIGLACSIGIACVPKIVKGLRLEGEEEEE